MKNSIQLFFKVQYLVYLKKTAYLEICDPNIKSCKKFLLDFSLKHCTRVY